MPLRNAGAAGTTGRYNAAGLPDLSGQMDGGGYYDGAEGVGALYPSDARPEYIMSSTSGFSMLNCKINFLASKSSLEYGAQPTVMPASADMVMGLYLGRTS